MAFYECTFIIRQDATQAEVHALMDRFSAIVTDNGGKIIKSESWGLRTLAYRIKKYRKGHYAMFGMEAPHATVKELERNLFLSEDVVRNMIVRVESLDDTPSVMMQQRTGRDDEAEGSAAVAA